MRATLLTAALVLAGKNAAAEPPLSLAEAQSEARAHAPEGAALEARLHGAEIAIWPASRIFRNNPTLSGTYSPGQAVGRPEEFLGEVGLAQTIDVSGSWTARGAAARADRDRARFDRDEGLLALDEAVAISFADVVFQQRMVEQADRIAKLFAVSVEAARKELEVGQGNQIDADQAALDYSGARAAAARARGDLGAARARLARLLGRHQINDIAVVDLPISFESTAMVDVDAVIDRNPRVQAAQAELRAARFELETANRTMWPDLTLGVAFTYQRRDIPAGSFSGPGTSGLSAVWTDPELSFSLSFPLPVFDRKQTERAQASAHILVADVELRKVRADLEEEVAAASSVLQAATAAYREMANTPEIIEREFDLLDKALRSGALDSVTRALALRRLQEGAGRFYSAVHDLRIAQALWTRRTSVRR